MSVPKVERRQNRRFMDGMDRGLEMAQDST
jgi:hypothetical protein